MATTVTVTTPAPPPNLSGNKDEDFVRITQWIWSFYRAVLANNAALQGSGSQVIDTSNLPDPATSSVATAQQTANEAYVLASQANETAEDADNRTRMWIKGTVTISDTDIGFTYTFTADETPDDSDYMVIVQAISSTGTFSVNSTIIKSKTYSTSDFVIEFAGAPGAGNSVTFDWIFIRLKSNA